MEQVDMNPTMSVLPALEKYSGSAEVSRSSAGVKSETQSSETVEPDISQTDITNLVASVEYVQVFSTKVTFVLNTCTYSNACH